MRSWLTGAAFGAVVGFAAVGVGSQAWSANNNDSLSETYRQLDLFAEVLARVKTDYVVEIDDKEAMTSAINGMLTSLDPHSSFLTADDFRSMQVQTSGEYGGLGIEVTMEDGLVKVIAPIDDTPASRAGVEAGDLISAIDGQPIVGMSLNDAVKIMRGEIGTDIVLTIIRSGEEDTLELTLTREVIRPKTVDYRIEANAIGYMRVASFNERTTDLLRTALDDLQKDLGRKPQGLILDLRNNPGGLFEQAVSVSDLFLAGGEVVSTRGRRASDIARYNASRAQRFDDVPIVVLINQGSASSSEIVAGALQDRERATVVGVTSFGKGSVQTVIPLGADRGAIRLTTARYYTPSGRSIQNTGIEPDIEISNRRYTEEEIERLRYYSESFLPNALQNEDGSERRAPHMPDEQPPEDYEGEDYQLDRAIEILQGQMAQSEWQRDNG